MIIYIPQLGEIIFSFDTSFPSLVQNYGAMLIWISSCSKINFHLDFHHLLWFLLDDLSFVPLDLWCDSIYFKAWRCLRLNIKFTVIV